jgi:hypothetical protein
MNNTKSQINKQKNQRQKTRQDQLGSKKQGQNPNMRHEIRPFEEHEHPELRMAR